MNREKLLEQLRWGIYKYANGFTCMAKVGSPFTPELMRECDITQVAEFTATESEAKSVLNWFTEGK